VTVSTWRALRVDAEHALADAGIEAAGSEARWIIEQASGVRGAALVTIEHEAPTALASTRVATMVRRRAAGEPLQYVLGEWSFRGLDLFVDRRVLIPRPETEVTAQCAIDVAVELGANRGRRNVWTDSADRFVVVDLGTGSGALALSLASELSDAEVWATDVSADALAVARANLAGTGSAATRVRLVEGDWYAALPDELRSAIDLIVTNPPYVGASELDSLPAEVREHEPITALVSGDDGLEAIDHIVDGALEWLAANGALVVEIAPHQADAVSERARTAGFRQVRVERDLTGRDRVLVARVQ